MDQSKSKEKKEQRFSKEQYKFLKGCTKKGEEGIKEWNKWRENNPEKDILLEGAKLKGAYLKGAFLATDVTPGIHKEVHLEKAFLAGAHLEEANLSFAHMEGAIFHSAHLERATLYNAYLRGSHLNRAHLQETNLRFAHLEDANLWFAHLEGADLTGRAHLQGANFLGATVDQSTLIWKCEINRYCNRDRYTDFTAVSLESASIDPGTKQILEYNIRRKNWEDWYWGDTTHKVFKRLETKMATCLRAYRVVGRLLLTSPVRLFWSISDYGLRTWRIIAWFFGLAVAFALAYRLWPSFVMVNGRIGDIRGLVHALYFSVVTMTTLGFGDIAANPDSWQGQVLLMVQVIFGYVLLGALVTRFAVLFTAGGPAGKFAKDNPV